MSISSAAAEAQLAKILHDDEQVLATLSTPKEKPLELSKKMFQNRIISKDLKDLFSFLDHSRVDPQLQVRYLLRLVSRRAEEDKSVWEEFLTFLIRNGEEKLVEYVRATVKARPPVYVDITLGSEDMSLISEILTPVSHKWELLGIALLLPKHERENCRRLDNKISLSNVLSCWLSGNDAMLDKLKHALSSNTVGEGRLALELEERISQAKITKRHSPENKFNISHILIINQSYDVEVADYKSTLLHVQVRPTKSVFYQWYKNGQLLFNDCTYSGVDDDILVVSHASQGTEGEYTCCVSSQEREEYSNKITLTVLYSPAKKKLLDLYSIRKEVPPDSWPPTGTETFVSLVLTKSDSEYFSKTGHRLSGDANEVVAKTKSKENEGVYEQVFFEYKKGTLVFIGGCPGSGKTTLVHKIIKDWTIGKMLRGATLVFIVTLTNINHLNEASLSNILSLFYHTDQQLKAATSDIESANGEGVCFILDGLDEYKPHDRDKSIIYKLLDKTCLPLAMIIVASRPAAVETLQQDTITQRIEVFGFTRENIREYIGNYPFGYGTSESANLKAYLDSHLNVFDMCYLPVHAAMICFLYNHGKGNLPCTQTKVYEEFTRSMILRHLKRHNRSVKIHSLEKLTGNTKKYFDTLCHLAYNMTVQVKQVVTPDEIDMQLSEDACSDDEWSLGLVTVNQVAQLYGIDDTYSFHHLTFQEFLAAYYIATLENQEQQKILADKELCKSLSTTVWTFYCGLVKLEDQYKLKVLFETLNTDHKDIMYMHYAFETQQQAVCDEVMKILNGVLHYSSLTPSDLSALGYVVSTTSQPLTALRVKKVAGIAQLLQQICSSDFQTLVELQISLPSDSGMQALTRILKSCVNLEDANISFGELRPSGAMYVADSFKHLAKLKNLHITFDSTFTGITILLSGLQYHTNTNLSLTCKWLKEIGFQELSRGLKCLENVNVEKITLFGELRPDSAKSFANGLHSCIHLDALEIYYYNTLEENICDIIVSALVYSCRRLKSLTVSRHHSQMSRSSYYIKGQCHGATGDTATPVGVVQHAGAFSPVDSASYVDVCSSFRPCATSVGDNIAGSFLPTTVIGGSAHVAIGGPACGVAGLGVTIGAGVRPDRTLPANTYPSCFFSLISKIKFLPSLEKLDLSRNNIGTETSSFLASELYDHTKLRKLDLTRNNLDLHDAISVVESLKNCPDLHYLGFHYSTHYTASVHKHVPPASLSGIHVEGLVSSDDEAGIDSLVAAVQHDTQDRELHLGFETLKVPSKNKYLQENEECHIL